MFKTIHDILNMCKEKNGRSRKGVKLAAPTEEKTLKQDKYTV
jgi:hypothetical protein